MNHYKQLKIRWGLWVAAFFIALAGYIIFNQNQNVTARSQEDATIVLSEEDDQTGVSYLIGVDNLENELIARVEYDRSSMESLDKYRAFNHRELAKILQGAADTDNIPLKMTFSSPLSQEAFTEFVEQYEIDVDSYYIYMLESDGNIATIQGGPSEEELVPGMFFNAATNSISQEYSPGVEFLGWVEVDGTVQVKHVPQLTADKRLFMVDVMQLFLESRLTDEVLANAGITRGVRQDLLRFGFAAIYRSGPAWNLYYLGVENPK